MTGRTRYVRMFGVALVAAVALVAGACGGSHSDMDMGDDMSMDMMGDMEMTLGTNPIPANADFNGADVEFAQGMIIHHGQAVEMADMALTNSTNPEVLALATEIKAAQEPEIAIMTGWLEQWGQPVPDQTSGMAMMDGDMAMEGMMSSSTMEEMNSLTGTAFDQLFLASMIEHHRGAIAMANYVIDNGTYAPVSALAAEVITVQEAEIAVMENLLTTL